MPVRERAHSSLVDKVRNTVMLRAFGLWKVPMIAWVRPVVEELTPDRCVVRIPLGRRTKNHLDSMYLGAYSVGADVTAGLLALTAARRDHSHVVPLFTDFHADFLQRATGDVLYTCNDGAAIRDAVARAAAGGERINLPVSVVATVSAKEGGEPVARMRLTLSLKRRRRRHQS